MRCRTSLVCTAVLPSYALLVCSQHRRPPFVRVAEPRWYAPLLDICMCSASGTITAGYIRMRFSSAFNIADLRSYALQTLAGMHRCLHSYALLVCHQHPQPPFVHVAEPHWYAPLSYIRTRCSSAVDITDLRSYVLQNRTGMHHCLHSYALLVCRQHRQTPFARIAEPHLYVPLSYIRMRCSSAIILHTILLRVRIAPLASFSLTYVRTCV